MKKEMAVGVIVSVLLSFVLLFTGCGGAKPTGTLTPTQRASTPSLTASQAMGLVSTSLNASVLRGPAHWFKAEFNYTKRQWVVTVWNTKEDSEKYLGDVYIVDDATGKVLNPPPALNPK